MKKFTILFIALFFLSKNVFAKNERYLEIDGKKQIYTEKPVNIKINNKSLLKFTIEPVILNEVTFVGVRDVFESLNAKISWDDIKKELEIIYNENVLLLEPNKQYALINGFYSFIDFPPKIINERLMIPLRFVSENLGFEISWDEKSRIISIKEPINVSVDNSLGTQKEDTVLNDSSLSNLIYEENQKITEEDLNTNQINKSKLQIKDISSQKLEKEENFKTEIIDIKIPYENDKNIFEIKAKSRINNFEKSIENDFLNITIDDSKLSLNRDFVVKNKKVEYINFFDDNNSVKISFKIKENTNFSTKLSEDRKSLFVFFDENIEEIKQIENILYDKNNKVLTIKKILEDKIDLNDFKKIDDYTNLKFTFEYLKKIDFLENGIFEFNDDFLNFIQIDNNKIVISPKKIFLFEINEKDKDLEIKFFNPKEKFEKIIVLDAGHGGKDPGTISKIFNLKEKNITLDIVLKLNKLLESSDIKVYNTRIDDRYLTLQQRVEIANHLGNLFLSVHVNSAGENTKINGIETFYSLKNNLGIFNSKKFADINQKNLLKNLNPNDRKVKSGDFYVIRETNIPAVLVEIGFLSNPEEAKKLSDDNYLDLVAKSIHESILQAFDIYNTKV